MRIRTLDPTFSNEQLAVGCTMAQRRADWFTYLL